MQEIWIPEFIASFLLLLFIARPYFKKLGAVEGLAWLPLPAMLIIIALFPAYGFHPEIIPLLLFAAFMAIFGIQRQLSEDNPFGNYRKVRNILAVPPLIILAAFAGTAFYFTPEKDTDLISEGIYSVKAVSKTENAGEREYNIRVYSNPNAGNNSKRPLLVIIPPVIGSVAAVDQVSGELRDRGFTVLNYSAGKNYALSPMELYRRLRIFSSGTSSVKANARGRALEKTRGEDIEFLLSWMGNNPYLDGKMPLFQIASPDAVFLAGYDAGGSALILRDVSSERTVGSNRTVSSDRTVGSNRLRIRGCIAIESFLWSLYGEEKREEPELPPDAAWFASVKHGLMLWLSNMKPKKISGPVQAPDLSSPFLFLVSDKSRESKLRNGRYLAFYRSYEAAQSYAVMAFADGTGPLDYSDFPFRYPLLSALSRGRLKYSWNDPGAPAETAKIITSFALSVLDADERSLLEKTSLSRGVSFTPNNVRY